MLNISQLIKLDYQQLFFKKIPIIYWKLNEYEKKLNLRSVGCVFFFKFM